MMPSSPPAPLRQCLLRLSAADRQCMCMPAARLEAAVWPPTASLAAEHPGVLPVLQTEELSCQATDAKAASPCQSVSE